MQRPGKDRDNIEISEEDLERLVSAMMKTLEMGIAVVYGDEDEGPEKVVDCQSRLSKCRALCCTFQFALTREEVKKGHIKYDPKRPYFIAHDPDGYCPHLNRDSLRCTIWEDRPMRCRKYDCSDDGYNW